MFPWGKRTFVVGIVNCSPDSFSGDGHPSAHAAVDHALRLADEGADALDVGGESTRPGADPVPVDEELRRVVPVIRELATKLRIPLSVDTSKAAVAAAALDAGAAIVNDVRALLGDSRMAEVVSSHHASVVLMDNRLSPRLSRDASLPAAADAARAAPPAEEHGYAPRLAFRGDERRAGGESDAITRAVAEWLALRVVNALDAGVTRERIILDPGLGFGKSPAQSLALLRHLGDLRRHPTLAGLPLLVGPSRKGFIGHVLGLPPEERLEGTLAAVAFAVAGGADLVRVHDVRAAARCVRVADAIARSP